MIQTANTMYNPMFQQPMACTTPAQSTPNYNAVKIDIHNPSVNPGGAQQYATPLYNYPQAPIYNYPVAQQPVYYPQVNTQAQSGNVQQPVAYPQPQVGYPQQMQAPVTMPQQPVYYPPVYPQAQPVQTQTFSQQPQVSTECHCPDNPVNSQQTAAVTNPVPVSVQQQNINYPQPCVPAPSVVPQEQAPVNNTVETKPVEQKPEVVNSTPVTPNVDLNTFIAKLSDPSFEAQNAAMRGIVDVVNKDPKQAEDFLDSKIYNALTEIVNQDTSKLEGPSKERIEAQAKKDKGENLTEEETRLLDTVSPLEYAETNKQCALYTIGILDKVFLDSLSQTNPVPPLAGVPCVDVLVNSLKDNPNEDVRIAAIESLSHISRPEYKNDLNTVFTVATNDVSSRVADQAKVALEELNKAAA